MAGPVIGCGSCKFKEVAVFEHPCADCDGTFGDAWEPIAPAEEKTEAPSPLSEQVGGDHYKAQGIQPVEYIHANKLTFFEGNIVKYTTRHRAKGKAEDIRKVIHYAQMILDLEYGETQ